MSISGITKFASNPTVQRIVSDLGNESKLLPVAILEASVLTGRSYQAQKRGGYYEFKETLLEGTLAAIIWMGGVKILNKVGDAFFKNVMKIDTAMDWKQVANYAKGRLNSEQFIKRAYSAKFAKLLLSVGLSIYAVGTILPKYKQKLTRESIERQKKEKEKLDAQQAAKKPAVNPDGTPIIPQNIKVSDLPKPANAGGHGHGVSFTGSKLKSKDPSFTGAFDIISKVGYALENQAIPQLAVVDTGITGGRVINSRNKDEAIEYVFRDASSAMFYYFCIPFLNKRFASMFDKKLGVNTMLDPKALNPVTDAIKSRIGEIAKANNGVIGIEEIQKALLGSNNETISQALKSALEANKGALTPQQIQVLVKDADSVLAKAAEEAVKASSGPFLKGLASDPALVKGIISRAATVAKVQADTVTAGNIRAISNLLDDVVKAAPSAAPEVQKASKVMSRLADIIHGRVQSGGTIPERTITTIEKMIGKINPASVDEGIMKKLTEAVSAIKQSGAASGVVTAETLEEVLKGGMAHDSQFIQKVLSGLNGAVKNPTKFVSAGHKVELQEATKLYAERLMEELKKIGGLKSGEQVSMEKVSEAINNTLSKTKSKTLLAKVLYIVAGIAIASLFLSTIIPKVQYMITKLRTGKEGFPGVAGLLDDDKPKTTKPEVPLFTQKVEYNSSSAAFNTFLKNHKTK